jgi:hypothetical protein
VVWRLERNLSKKGVEELKTEMAKPRAARSAEHRLVLIVNALID